MTLCFNLHLLLLLVSSNLKAINFGTFDNNILGLAIDKDVAGSRHIAALGQVDDEEEAGAGEGVVELVEVLAVPALDHLRHGDLQKEADNTDIQIYFSLGSAGFQPAFAIVHYMTKLNKTNPNC